MSEGISPEQINELATAPKKTAGDEGSIEERSIEEVIAADRYATTKDAAKRAPYGMRLGRFRSPGTP